VPPDLPLLAAAYVVLVVVVLCRAGGTYALGRLGRRAGDGSRRARLSERPLFRRSEQLVARFGPPAVTASFLTVGLQSAVNLSAGFLRMPLLHYLPALALGSMIWAGIYLSVGVAVVKAWAAGEGLLSLLGALALLAIVAGTTLLLRRRRPEGLSPRTAPGRPRRRSACPWTRRRPRPGRTARPCGP
jgi:membrane protein DedA with SNARE-associated domain